jgi:hypothetical protein
LKKLEKLLNYEDYKLYRFQCDCLSPEDALDVVIDSYCITISMNRVPSNLKEKIKDIINVLRGEWTYREFILRENDREELIKVLRGNSAETEVATLSS